MSAENLFHLGQDLFAQAVELPREERAAFVARACVGSPGLAAEVGSLLAAHDQPGGLLLTAVDDAEAEGPAPAPRRDGQRIGRYTIVATLGAGSMGVVYEAEQDEPTRRVALKVMRTATASRHAARRFADEARALGRLNHPGIAQIYEAGVFDDDGEPRPFLAMELVRGASLTAFAAARSLDRRARLELFAAACEAVESAHARGVVHRDLKPSNILAAEDWNGALLPKVVDFGIASLAGGEPSSTKTVTGERIVGSFPYLSPEQAEGRSEAAGPQSDVYSLGVILFELLTGRLPWDADWSDLLLALRMVREQEPARLQDVSRDLRGDLDAIVATAMDRDPPRRYATAGALARDIREHLADRPISARAPNSLTALIKFSKRHRGLVAGLAAAWLVLVAGSAVSVWLAVRANRSAARADPRSAQLLKFSSDLLSQVNESIMHVPGALEARKRLTQIIASNVRAVEGDLGTDPNVLVDIGRVYESLARLQAAPDAANLGQYAEAESNYGTALLYYDAAARQGADDDVIADLRAQVHVRVSQLLDSQDRVAEAVPELEAALVLRLEAARSRPASMDLWRKAAESLQGLVRLKTRTGDPDGAARAVQLFVASFPLDATAPPEDQAELGVIRLHVGRAWLDAGRNEAALQWLQHADAALVTACQQTPARPRLLLDRGDVWRFSAQAHSQSGNTAEQLVDLDRAVAIYREAWTAIPDHLAPPDVLAIALIQRAAALEERGDIAAAVRDGEEAVEIFSELLALDPDSVQALDRVMRGSLRVGQLVVSAEPGAGLAAPEFLHTAKETLNRGIDASRRLERLGALTEEGREQNDALLALLLAAEGPSPEQ